MFQEIIQVPWVQLLIAIGLATLPVFIWMNFLFQKKDVSKKTLIKVFLFGVFSVLPLLGIQYIWLFHPEFDVYEIAQKSATDIHLGFLFTFIAVGIFEEITKFNMLRHLKWAKVEIKSINDAMRYILVIALGFAFTENILYFLDIIRTAHLGELFSAVVFRAIFTTAGHMTFSSIVAYYYAIGKFGNPILELDRWTGRQHKFLAYLQEKLGFKESNIFHIQQTLEGLYLAMGLHALFNFSLQMNKLGYALGIVILGFILQNRSAEFPIPQPKSKIV